MIEFIPSNVELILVELITSDKVIELVIILWLVASAVILKRELVVFDLELVVELILVLVNVFEVELMVLELMVLELMVLELMVLELRVLELMIVDIVSKAKILHYTWLLICYVKYLPNITDTRG